jgi:hypothetical protein
LPTPHVQRAGLPMIHLMSRDRGTTHQESPWRSSTSNAQTTQWIKSGCSRVLLSILVLSNARVMMTRRGTGSRERSKVLSLRQNNSTTSIMLRRFHTMMRTPWKACLPRPPLLKRVVARSQATTKQAPAFTPSARVAINSLIHLVQDLHQRKLEGTASSQLSALRLWTKAATKAPQSTLLLFPSANRSYFSDEQV